MKWWEAGTPGTESKTKLVSSSNRGHDEKLIKCHLILITVTVCTRFFFSVSRPYEQQHLL